MTSLPFSLVALDFTVTGGWSLSIGGADLQGGPGSDLTDTYLSAANAVVIDITNAVDQFEQWYVDIHRVDVNWDSGLSLSALRTSDGSGLGTIAGGLAVQPVTTAAAEFFQGTGDRSAIQVQLVLSGVSVTLGRDGFSTQIVYTLRDAN
jgi:hypothetical protein